MNKIILSLVLLAVSGIVFAQSAVLPTQAALSWIAPTQNTDGSTLTAAQIASYNIYYGTTSGGPYTNKVSIAGTATSTTITNLTNGTWYFVATTVGTDGLESAYSNEGSKTISVSLAPTPSPPGFLTVK